VVVRVEAVEGELDGGGGRGVVDLADEGGAQRGDRQGAAAERLAVERGGEFEAVHELHAVAQRIDREVRGEGVEEADGGDEPHADVLLRGGDAEEGDGALADRGVAGDGVDDRATIGGVRGEGGGDQGSGDLLVEGGEGVGGLVEVVEAGPGVRAGEPGDGGVDAGPQPEGTARFEPGQRLACQQPGVARPQPDDDDLPEERFCGGLGSCVCAHRSSHPSIAAMPVPRAHCAAAAARMAGSVMVTG